MNLPSPPPQQGDATALAELGALGARSRGTLTEIGCDFCLSNAGFVC